MPKILDLSARSAVFPDPLGLGNNVNLALAIFGEAVRSILITLGLFTRLAATPFLITMLTRGLSRPFGRSRGKKDFALLYAAPALTLIFTGAGAFSIDGWRQRHR